MTRGIIKRREVLSKTFLRLETFPFRGIIKHGRRVPPSVQFRPVTGVD
jgi:hypothetical protein